MKVKSKQEYIDENEALRKHSKRVLDEAAKMKLSHLEKIGDFAEQVMLLKQGHENEMTAQCRLTLEATARTSDVYGAYLAAIKLANKLAGNNIRIKPKRMSLL